jgi:uncharacterized lipoprotein YajG
VQAKALKLAASAAAMVLLSGCAATRSTIDVAAAKPAALPTAAPKVQVAIVRVNDARQFEAAPRSPSTPSLQSAEDLNNPQIRARAVARKRGGFGQALADILLPEGRSVAQLVREAATQALRDKGYGVVDASAAAGNALPLELEIKQYWAWFTPGFWAIKLEFEAIVAMKGDMLIGDKELTVRTYAIAEAMAATDAQWSRILQQGYDDLVAKMKAALRDP